MVLTSPVGPTGVSMPHASQNSIPGQSRAHSFSRKFAVFLILFLLRLVVVAETPENTVPFKSPHRYMIVVSVRVNGSGPYSFLLDTGATSSVVDPQLSAALNLPSAQDARLANWNDTTDARRVLVQDLSLGPIDSGPLPILVQPLFEFKTFDSHLRGVLGQDVLLRSNFLIDNRHHRIQFDNDGSLLPQLEGDRVSIAPIRTRTGDLEPRLLSVLVRSDRNPQPLH